MYIELIRASWYNYSRPWQQPALQAFSDDQSCIHSELSAAA